MRDVLKVGNTQAKPGTVEKGTLGTVELAGGLKASVPVINVNGAEDGPILTVITSVHGIELAPIKSLGDAVKRIDPAKMKGALIGVPASNPLAIHAGTYHAPDDHINLSGPLYLPTVDKRTADVTKRLAIYINEALEKADYVLDFHCNPLPSIHFVLTDLEASPNDKVREDQVKMAEAFGITIINHPTKQATSIRECAIKAGKAALTPELSGGFVWPSISKVGTIGILNIMKAFGMLDGELEKQDVKVVKGGNFYQFGWLYAQRGGFMVVKKDPGEYIPKGETAVEIIDVYGDIIDEAKMPVNGYCWSFTGNYLGTYAVTEGTRLAYVFADQSEFGDKSLFVEKADFGGEAAGQREKKMGQK